MYQPLLTRRYLFSKVMPLLAAVAVSLCTAMVLIVWSVMGGFLNMLLASGRSMIGDVSIAYPAELGGIPNYQAVIDALEMEPEVAAATPILETYALLGLPDGDKRFVVLVGVEPVGYDAVTGYYDRIYWRPLIGEERAEAERYAAKLRASEGGADEFEQFVPGGDRRLEIPEDSELVADARRLAEPPLLDSPGRVDGEADAEFRAAVVPGVMVSKFNRRSRGGHLIPRGTFLPSREVSITVLAISRRGAAIDAETRPFPVANEFESGLFDADSRWVLMPLDELQEMLRLDAAERVEGVPTVAVDPETGEETIEYPAVVGAEPARVSTILVRAVEDINADELEVVVERVYESLLGEASLGLPSLPDDLIYTWEEKPGLAGFIAAVRKETVLVLFLFGVISLVAVFLVFAIFWAMISEKTKDIGVLRAIGGSTYGIAWLFLRYGLAIGVVGAVVGLVIAMAVVWNINAIHTWLGTALGIEIWSPETYYFSEIPSEIELSKVLFVTIAAALSSLLGALVPAIRAAWMDPVRALRFE